MREGRPSLVAVRSALRSPWPSGLPPEAPDVEQQHRDDEQEDQHRDRRSDAEVVAAAERRSPHRQREHVGVVLTLSRGNEDDDVEHLEHVDQHRHEDHGEPPAPARGVTLRNTWNSLAPSVRAASSTSRGIAARPAAITTIAKPAQIHR